MNLISGLVLCGGESTRMGSDKGLLNEGEKKWSQIAFEKLSVYCDEVFISINKSQVENYTNHFHSGLLIEDSVDIKGPLCGLLSFNQKFPQKNVLILACDMLKVTDQTLNCLIKNYESEKEIDFIVYKNNEQIEPLCGIYIASALTEINKNYLYPSLKDAGIKNILISGKTLFLKHPYPSELENFNYPDF